MALPVSFRLLLVAFASPPAFAQLPSVTLAPSRGNGSCNNIISDSLVSIFSPDSIFSNLAVGALTIANTVICPPVPQAEVNILLASVEIYLCYGPEVSNCQIEKLDDISNVLTGGHWNTSRGVCIFFPGWIKNAESEDYSTEVMKAYYKNGTCNLLIVNAPDVNNQFYTKSVSLLPPLAQKLAEAFKKLALASGGSVNNITMVGHSLGAHLAGYTARLLKGLNYIRVIIIIALDPAGPCFSPSQWQCQEGVRCTDADYVMAVHSDGGRFGTDQLTGCVDYFINNGTAVQPGCTAYDVTPNACTGQFLCSHVVSLRVICDSLMYPGSVVGRWCPSKSCFARGVCSNFTTNEINTVAKQLGTYFLTTNNQRPYGKGMDGT